jgi:putative hemolysin
MNKNILRLRQRFHHATKYSLVRTLELFQEKPLEEDVATDGPTETLDDLFFGVSDYAEKEKRALVRPAEVAEFLGISHWGPAGTGLATALMRMLKLDQLNRIYDSIAHLPPAEFIPASLEKLQVSYQIPKKDLERIPKEGPAILVSNHPTILDGQILLNIVYPVRSDVKILGNFLMQRIEPLKDQILPVNPFEQYRDARSSLAGLKRALHHLRSGGILSVFPAGEISGLDEKGQTADREWQEGAIKLIQKAEVMVIPVYFDGKNTRMFYLISRIRNGFRTALLPRELVNKKGRQIRIRIGQPLSPELLKNYTSTREFGELLRTKTYWLRNGFVRETDCPDNDRETRVPPVAPPTGRNELLQEIESCRQNRSLLFNYKQFDVILTNRTESPRIVEEIGRLREITFREIGEGTMKPLDLDQYDDYYQHLFVFDNEEKKITGAYRLGIGHRIFTEKGIAGFYLNDLFEFAPAFHPILEKSIDMGRAFIIKERQRSHMGLFLLWKGIVFVITMEKAGYLIGGVSISNNYSPFSRSVIVEWLRNHHFDPLLAGHIRERNPFVPCLSETDRIWINRLTGNDIRKADRLVDELETEYGMRIPVLMKKYIQQNGKFIGFNIDPDFNDAVDGLMIAKISELPGETLDSGLAEFEIYAKKHRMNC